MALYPNGRYMTRSTYKGLGVAPGLDARLKGKGDRFNRFVNASFARTASTPDGYDMKGSVPPVRAGSMATLRPVASLTGAASLLQGGPMAGGADVLTLAGAGNVSLVVGMEGAATVVSMAGDGLTLKLTIGLDGSGSISLTGDGNNLALIVPFEGIGSIASLSGTSDLRGLLSMSGEWTPFTELSPEGLARAVWGKIIEAGFSAEQIIKILAANAAGSASGLEGLNPTFTGLDGHTIRINGTYSSGERTINALNGD